MNRQPFHVPPRRWAPRMNRGLVRLWRPLRRRALRRKQRMVEIVVSGHEPVRDLLASGAGVLITPNHAFHYDSYVVMEAAHQLGRPAHIMTAWQVFAMSRPWEQWVLQQHGCFSIDRENTDLQAFRQAVDILRDAPHPLVIFPEGEIYHTNDRVTPFREGAAAIALSAARRGDRPIYCTPCALKCWYLDDPTEGLLRVMDELERRLFWRPQPALPLADRIYRFADGLLALKEMEYLGRPHAGSINARVAALSNTILSRMENRYQLPAGRGTVPERVKELRRSVIKQSNAAGDDVALQQKLACDMDDLFLVTQLFSYPGDYAAEKPSIERLAETIDKFEEDVLGVDYPRVRGRRRVEVRFGAPLDVPHERGQQDASELTNLLEHRVQCLLDQINHERDAGVRSSGHAG